MSDTPGSLVDKISIINLKLFHNQELLYAIRRMNYDKFLERFKAVDSEGIKELYDWLQKMSDLNSQRNMLIDEFDTMIAAAIKTGDTSYLSQHKHKTGPVIKNE